MPELLSEDQRRELDKVIASLEDDNRCAVFEIYYDSDRNWIVFEATLARDQVGYDLVTDSLGHVINLLINHLMKSWACFVPQTCAMNESVG